ncbi:MAG: maleylpyruvate isomerase N-terminal domain-containing protein [Streptosporangiaceae bacterium]
MERTHSWEMPAPLREPVPVLAVYNAGIAAICRLAAQFDETTWSAQTPCPEWRACDLAGHLRCISDDLHEYLDEAPVSRYARLMATGAHPDTLSRKLARQNAAELAALADGAPDEHVTAFAESARRYAARLGAVWELPHHQYRDTVVTVGGMAGAASAEWHLHAWDLAMALGADYRPADPAAVLAGWLAGMPHRPLPSAPRSHGGWSARHPDPWHAVLAVSGRRTPGGPARARSAGWVRQRLRRKDELRLRRKG